MERSEPTLVPEWLRSTGSVTGGGSSAHHSASSSSLSDGPSLANSTRNRSLKNNSDFDNPRSAFLDRSNSRRSSSSNGSSKHAYSSFSRSHRDKDRDREKERSVVSDRWDRECFDHLGNILSGRGEKDALRRSRSMVSSKQGEMLSRRVTKVSRNGGNNNHHNGNGVLSGGIIGSSIQKAAFEKDFPTLGTEERQGVPEIGRVSSPGLSTAVQSLPIGNSALIGGEGWSALAEVPVVIGSNSMGPPTAQQTAAATPVSGSSSTMAGLNMAEALAQPPMRARTAPQISVESQKLEEWAIRKSRQLIPMTPSMPKTSVLSSSDKSKPKAAVRPGELIGPAKSVGQQLSLHVATSQSFRGGHVKPDTPKTSSPGGKFLVLKPVWENGVTSVTKDVSSPTNNNLTTKVANNPPAVPPSVPSAPIRNPNNIKLSSTVERKATAALALNQGPSLEKRPSQAQSRNDFFNLMRKKTSLNNSTVMPDSGPVISSSTMEKSDEVIIKEVDSVPASSHENGEIMTSNGDASCHVGENNSVPSGAVVPEEEAAFLRSLGWDENAGDEGLTEEEINSFIEEYVKLKPSLKRCGGKLLAVPESQATDMGRVSVSSESSSSESEA